MQSESSQTHSAEEATAAPSAARLRLLALGLLGVSLLVSLLLAEWAVSAVRPQLVLDVPSQHRVPDPRLGWVLEPNADYVHRVDEDLVHVRVNSRGWHDRERALARPDGVSTRIAVLGDSFVESYSVDPDDSLTRQLEARLGAGTEVLNFGVGGYGTLQALEAFRRSAGRFQPDLVLLGFCVGNDARNNSLELESMLAGSAIEAPARPYLRDSDDEVDAPIGDAEVKWPEISSLDPFRKLLGRSALASGIARIWGRFAGPSAEDFELAVHGVHYCREPAEYERAWRATGRILRQLRDDVHGLDAELMIFTEPTYREVHDAARRSIETRSLDPSKLCLDAAPGFDRLRDVAGEFGIPVVDLLPAFRHGVESNVLFRTSDRHWNPAGHALVAESLHKEIVRRGLASASQAALGERP